MIQLISILGIWLRGLSHYASENAYKDVHGSTVHYCKNIEIIQILSVGEKINEWWDNYTGSTTM